MSGAKKIFALVSRSFNNRHGPGSHPLASSQEKDLKSGLGLGPRRDDVGPGGEAAGKAEAYFPEREQLLTSKIKVFSSFTYRNVRMCSDKSDPTAKLLYSVLVNGLNPHMERLGGGRKDGEEVIVVGAGIAGG